MDIQNLVGQRVFHTAPGYGFGTITQAYLNNNSDVFFRISFDNNRIANPFSLANCIGKGLVEFDNPEVVSDILNQFDNVEKNRLKTAKGGEEKRPQEETIRIEANRERQIQEKRSIFNFLTKERKVQFLVHFTPISNLPSILSRGIMPRSALVKEGIHADTPDEKRLDSRMDYSSFSISLPNYRVFFSKRRNTPYSYAVLLVDPQIILDLPLSAISYLPDNAASRSIHKVERYTGLKAAQSLFAEVTQIGDAVVSRKQLKLLEHYTTNPQAEVFVRSVVGPEYIRRIVTESYAQMTQLKTELTSLSVPIPTIIHDRKLYDPRDDWRSWTAKMNTTEE